MSISILLFSLAVVFVVALLILYALSRDGNVKACWKLPFAFFSFEANQPGRTDPRVEKNLSPGELVTQSGQPRHVLYAVRSQTARRKKAHGTRPVPWLPLPVGGGKRK
jgi:hypothetical protein